MKPTSVAGSDDVKQVMAKAYELYLKDRDEGDEGLRREGAKTKDDLRTGEKPGEEAYDQETW